MGAVPINGLAETLRINPSAVQKHIQRLKNKGHICRVGPDKGGYWEIVK
jgi:ATP-dependent DNA helicase RecG